MRSVQFFHPMWFKYTGHRRNAFEIRLYLCERIFVQNTRVRSRLERIVWENIPSAKRQIRKIRKWHKLSNRGRAILCAFADANRPKLRQRTDGLREPLPHRLDTGNRRRSDGTHARKKHTEFSLRGPNFFSWLNSHVLLFLSRLALMHDVRQPAQSRFVGPHTQTRGLFAELLVEQVGLREVLRSQLRLIVGNFDLCFRQTFVEKIDHELTQPRHIMRIFCRNRSVSHKPCKPFFRDFSPVELVCFVEDQNLRDLCRADFRKDPASGFDVPHGRRIGRIDHMQNQPSLESFVERGLERRDEFCR